MQVRKTPYILPMKFQDLVGGGEFTSVHNNSDEEGCSYDKKSNS